MVYVITYHNRRWKRFDKLLSSTFLASCSRRKRQHKCCKGRKSQRCSTGLKFQLKLRNVAKQEKPNPIFLLCVRDLIRVNPRLERSRKPQPLKYIHIYKPRNRFISHRLTGKNANESHSYETSRRYVKQIRAQILQRQNAPRKTDQQRQNSS